MTVDTGYDAAYPPAVPPKTQVVLIYAGGDTPHPWTATDIDKQTARYRFPIWVRSNPVDQAEAARDAAAFIAWLHSWGVQPGVYTMLDLETAVNPAYVSAFGNALHNAGYKVAPYGSVSTLYRNPALDGYFPAEPNATAIPPGCVGVQYGYEASIDLDYISPNIPMWDTQPGPTPNFQSSEDKMFAYDPETGGFWATDANGDVYAENGAPFIPGLNTHPEWHAGNAESGGVNKVVGLTTFKDKNGQVGLVFATNAVSGPVPYSFYRIARNGQPD